MSVVSSGNDGGGKEYPRLSNIEFIQKWINWKSEHKIIARNTRETYSKSLEQYGQWLFDHRAKEIIDTEPQDILDFNTHLCNRDIRNATIYIRMFPVKSALEWASELEVIPPFKFPVMAFEKGTPHTAIIPSAKYILSIRSGQAINSIYKACIYETLLSSGLRCSELVQIRCCDIQFDAIPIDYDLGRPSPFAGARIDLTYGKGIRTKSKSRTRKRITYISRLAAKLCRLQMQHYKIAETSALPLFPYLRQDIKNCVYRISVDHAYDIAPETNGISRKTGFLDLISSDVHGADMSYVEKINRIREKEKEKQCGDPIKQREVRIEKGRAQRLHPHALRHFFSVWQYYRGYDGNRRNIIGLRDMLGHESVDTTDVYVTGETYIENDFQWKQIAAGNGSEYRSLFV